VFLHFLIDIKMIKMKYASLFGGPRHKTNTEERRVLRYETLNSQQEKKREKREERGKKFKKIARQKKTTKKKKKKTW